MKKLTNAQRRVLSEITAADGPVKTRVLDGRTSEILLERGLIEMSVGEPNLHGYRPFHGYLPTEAGRDAIAL